MSTRAHHPTDLTMAAYAAGSLDEARRLLVATHVSLCAQCEQTVRAFEHVGGRLLDGLPATPMRPGALSCAMAGLAAPQSEPNPLSHPPTPELPAPLAAQTIGPWRWLGFGVRWCSVAIPVVDETRVFMLRAEPGTRLPRHRHGGIEWTCVLEGAFRHDLGRFGPGDFDEADETMEHSLVVEQGGPCVCLVGLQRNLHLQGWRGRLLQPLIRI